MHKTRGERDPALAFPLAGGRDDADERRQANRAIAVSAIGLAVTGLAELLLAVLTGSVGLLGDAIHRAGRDVGEVLPPAPRGGQPHVDHAPGPGLGSQRARSEPASRGRVPARGPAGSRSFP